MAKILIVEDEKPISNLIRMFLTKEGHECDCAFDGMKACDLIETHNYDLILLDIMLPYVDGFEVMEYAKSIKISVIFLTAMDTTNNKVKGLRMGAEDYITKPFEMAELIARVDNVLRRSNSTNRIYNIHNLKIDFNKRLIEREEETIVLTELEFDLLEYFIKNIDKPLTREQIYENVWGGEYDVESRTIDMSLRRLKKKLYWDKEIVSVYKVGYRLLSSIQKIL
ncbi:response regulator transcription factor [Clostridium grantii]|uniref:Stage 0 sporulation protein A homolog n=1 Tax=Clostridium grantii DSM 8605 TaxID=1121316 RepID=A0A1M5SYQ7_9CLOT|nr:response regulator transcription factor [Clostridium grantii]SHH43478.1 DNA-binding response regulator, OmpR family, contains REC and winged-helix (wHTH) domain [Clostridium grantii DSM 8605]